MNPKLNTARISRWVRLLFLSTVVGTLCMSPLWSVLAQQPEMKSVYHIAKSGNGQILGVTYNVGMPRSAIDLFDSTTGELLRTVDISPSLPNLIALNGTGDHIAHAGPDGDLGIFDVTTGVDTLITTGVDAQLDDIEWNPTNNQIAYAVGSGIYILDTSSDTLVRSINAGGPRVGAVAWSPNGQQLVTSHYAQDLFNANLARKNIKIWDMTSSENPLTVPITTLENRGGGSVSWNPKGNRLALLERYRLFIYDIATQKIVTDLPLDDKFPHMVAWNSTGNLLATGGKSLRIWDTTTWKVTQTLTLSKGASSFQWSFDGQHIFSDGGQDGLYVDDMPVSKFLITPTSTPSSAH